ncbi:exosome complex component MTR3 isoform X2 [Euwallacea fornicatus]|uniref:exosome complex component MTR3 isoform X2 n=1 Tax=Euwallacea fornicatus TaxID=995702 RepID=UPI00338DF258
MPVDNRRINGPEESFPYELFVRSKLKTTENAPVEGLQPSKIEDGLKTFGEQRKIFLQTGVVSQAKGSAYIEIGRTKVTVSVFDPREIPKKNDYGLKGEIFCEFKYAPFSCTKRKLYQQNAEEKLYSSIMKKALESTVCLFELPNFQVDVYAMVLEEDGSALSGAITAAGVALAEAGVPMYDLITSVTLGIKKGMLLEPPFELSSGWKAEVDASESESCGIMVISKLHTHKQICQFYQSGFVSKECVKQCIKLLLRQCDSLVPVVQKCLVKGIVSNIKK